MDTSDFTACLLPLKKKKEKKDRQMDTHTLPLILRHITNILNFLCMISISNKETVGYLSILQGT